jgi:hypothetical protein
MSGGYRGLDLATQLRHGVRRLMRHGKYLVGSDPILLPLLLRLTPEGLSRQITQQTDLVVEGFPRSGNTFTVFALRNASKNEIQIASHVHHTSQIKYAVAHGVPTLLVVREPVATLASYLVYGQHGRPSAVIREYSSYHRELVPYADRLLICDFSEVSTDFSAVIARVNQRHGLAIPPFDQTSANVERVFAEISQQHKLIHRDRDPAEVVPRPSAGRLEASERMIRELLLPKRRQLLEEALELHDFFSRKAAEQKLILADSNRRSSPRAKRTPRSFSSAASNAGDPRHETFPLAPDPSTLQP